MDIITKYENSTSLNQTTKKCSYVDLDLLNWVDLFNSALVPGTAMLFNSLVTIKCIFDSRKRFESSQVGFLGRHNRDTKFAITSISMNAFFLISNLPLCLFNVYKRSIVIDTSNLLAEYITNLIYYASFASVFYISFLTNSLFKKEVLKMIRCSSDNERMSSSRYSSTINTKTRFNQSLV